MSVAYCRSFGLELLQGTHAVGTDVFKIALFDANADFDVDTTAYSTTNEITIEGYTAGGATLTVSSGYPAYEGDRPSVRFDMPVTWTFVDPGTVRWALIYNSSKSNRAVMSIDMGSHRVSGAFEFNIPLTAPPVVSIAFPVVR